MQEGVDFVRREAHALVMLPSAQGFVRDWIGAEAVTASGGVQFQKGADQQAGAGRQRGRCKFVRAFSGGLPSGGQVVAQAGAVGLPGAQPDFAVDPGDQSFLELTIKFSRSARAMLICSAIQGLLV